MIVAGAVNGVPAKLNAKEGSGIVLPFAENGVAGTQEFQKNGDIFLPPGSGPDRVAIIGGSTVGRDHIPPPYQASDWTRAIVTDDEHNPLDLEFANGRGDGYIFPFGFAAADYLRYQLRVRKWRFSMTATIAKSVAIEDAEEPPFYDWVTGGAFIEFDYEFAYVGSGNYILASRESDTIRVPGRRFIQFNLFADSSYSSNDRGTDGNSDGNFPRIKNVSASVDPDFIPSGATNAMFLGLRQDVLFDFFDSFVVDQISGSGFGGWIAGQWWPRIQFFIGISQSDTRCETAWRGRLDTSEAKGTFAFDGRSASIVGPPPGSADDNPGGCVIFAVNPTISPIEFWPYATKAGLAVYDTGTGAQLREPLS